MADLVKIDTAVRRMPGISGRAISVTASTMLVTHEAPADLSGIWKKVSGSDMASSR